MFIYAQILTSVLQTTEGVSRTASTSLGPTLVGVTEDIVWQETGELALVSTRFIVTNGSKDITVPSLNITDVNECVEGLHSCEQVCVNTPGAYSCSCNNGFTLDTDRRTCNEEATRPPNGICGGRLTAAGGSFQTPGWPTAYPQQNFQCEWIIDLPDENAVIEFTTEDMPFGINGRPPCTKDYIQFFDGVDSTSTSLHKTCQYRRPPVLKTSSSRARVVFAGSINLNRPAGRVGVKVTYRTIQSSEPAPASPPDETLGN